MMDAQHARPVGKEDSNALSNSGRRAATSAESGLSVDSMFGLLSNFRRRTVLRLFRHTEGEVEFDEIVNVVAEEETGKPIEDVESGERRTVYTALYQTHLPRLKEEGVIGYDRVSGTIWRGERFEDLDHWLAELDGEDEKSLGDRISGALSVLC